MATHTTTGSVRDGAFRFLEVVHANDFRLRGNVAPDEKQSLNEEEDDRPQGLTQLDAANRAGISRPSVASYAQRLRGTILRKDTLAIRAGSGYAIGVDFSQTHGTRVALGNITGKIVKILPEGAEPRQLVRERPDDAIGSAHRGILRLLDEYSLGDEKPIGVGVGLPGPVRGGKLIGAGRRDWRTQEPQHELAKRLGWEDVEFETQSDTYLSALAESMWGTNKAADNMLYIKWSAALRAAIVIQGDLYTGHTGTAGELQHIVIAPNLEPAACPTCEQKGCVHLVAPLTEISRRISARKDEKDLGLRAWQVVAAMDEDESGETMRELELAASGLGKVIRPMIDMLDPKTVVIGGALGSRVFPRVEGALREGIGSDVFAGEPKVELRAGRLKHRTAVCGAVALALLRFTPAFLRQAAGD